MKKPGDVNGIQFAIRYLEDCDASLYDWSSQVSSASLIQSVVGHGGLMQELQNFGWTLPRIRLLQRLRKLHDHCGLLAIQMQRLEEVSRSFFYLFSCDIYLYAANDPVIEASSNLRFAPFNVTYPGLAEQAEKA